MLVGLAKDIKVDWKGGNLSGGKKCHFIIRGMEHQKPLK